MWKVDDPAQPSSFVYHEVSADAVVPSNGVSVPVTFDKKRTVGSPTPVWRGKRTSDGLGESPRQ